MKKIIALVVAIVMMAAISVPAFAEFSDADSTTLVTYGVDQTYVVVVPSDIQISTVADGDGDFVGYGTLKVLAGYKVAAGKSVHVTMNSNRAAEQNDVATKWYLNNTNAEGADLEYEVHLDSKDGTAVERGSTTSVLEAASGVGTTEQSRVIYCVTEGTDLADQFTDTLTFAAEVK